MRDNITVKFEVEAEFDTIQEIRQAFEDEVVLDLFKRQLTGVAQTRIRAEVDGEFNLETNVKVSSYRDTRKGPRAPIPQVKNGVLSWFDPYEERKNIVGRVGSEYWLKWLDDPENKSFAYTSKDKATFTAMKRKDGVWYAHKRLNGKLKRKYLGKSHRLTKEKMDKVAFELAQRQLE